MDEVSVQIADRKARVEQAQRARLQAEATLEQARSGVSEVARMMREEFGISPEQAPALKAQLEAEVQAELAAADAALSGAGL